MHVLSLVIATPLLKKNLRMGQVQPDGRFELRHSIQAYKKAALQRLSRGHALNTNPDRGDCWLGLLGSDWGCCGHYSRCCWLETMGCFLHDAACINCEPRWFCTKWCVPGD